jgi:hypothetical protein
MVAVSGYVAEISFSYVSYSREIILAVGASIFWLHFNLTV